MRRALLIAAVLLLVGCGGRPAPKTDLTVLALNSSVGRALFHLTCSPAGGDLPDTSRACAAIGAQPALVTRPKPFVCAGGTFSWWDITVSGRFRGRPLRRFFSTCWTPQMATIGRLGLSWHVLRQHLEPRRREGLIGGQEHTYAAGVLRPADLVTCDVRGHHLEAGVPDQPVDGGETVGYGGAHVVSVSLNVRLNADGSVTARCR